MKKYKINGQSIEIATSWDDVKFGTFIDLIDVKDEWKQIIAILIGWEPETVKKAKIEGLESLIPELKFLKEPAKINETPISLGGHVFPKDIGMESVEKFEAIRDHIKLTMQKPLKEQTEALAMYAAIYMTEPFDLEDAKKKAETFKDLPCLEVMSAGHFFQVKVLSMESGLSMSFLNKNTPMKKNRRGLGNLMKRLASMLRLITSPGMWGRTTKNLSKSGV